MTATRKLIDILTPTERRAGAGLLGLMAIGMVLETMGLGAVIPAVALLTSSDPAARYPALRPVLAWLGNPSQSQLAIEGMLALVTVYTVKTLYLGFLTWRQTKFGYDAQANLSQRLFTIYLRQPYPFHLERNSAQLIRNAINEVNQFTFSILLPLLLLLSEGFMLIGIAALLFFVEPIGTAVIIVVLASASWLFHAATRGRIGRWGASRQYHEGLRLQHLQQGLGGAKDVKLLGRETEFLETYRAHNLESARMTQYQVTLQNLPKLWLELLAVASLAIVVMIMVGQGRDMSRIVGTIALFGAAAVRLMPSMNRVINAVQALRYGVPVIDLLRDELRLPVPIPPPTRHRGGAFRDEVEVDTVSFRYPTGVTNALDRTSIIVRRGESVGVIGSSGSGKSTLVDIVLGLLTPSDGVVRVDGEDIQSDLRAWQDQVGYVPQSVYLTDDTLRRNVAFGLEDAVVDDAAVHRALKAAQLEDFVGTLPAGIETVVGERGVRLSGGQRQRIGIARALYHDPPVLVLDEATSALDTMTEAGVMEAVTALHGDKTILIVAHRLTTVEHCDRLYRLEHGRVVSEGSPQGVLQQAGTA